VSRVSILWVACLGTAAFPADVRSEPPCPFAAHNCYSDLGARMAERRLAEALTAGLRHIEVDVNYQPSAGGFVVTHKSDRPPSEPLLHNFLVPLWKTWRSEPYDHTLIIDLKAGDPTPAGRALHDYLKEHRDALSRFAPDGTLRSRGPVSVCLTGSRRIGQAYLNLAAQEGELLARRDEGFGGASAREALRRYLRQPPHPGVGYLTINWNVVVGDQGESQRTGLSGETRAWLTEIVAGARRHGYRLRFYTLNVRHFSHPGEPLIAGGWDAAWAACVQAGVDMISTDQYTLAVEWWKQIGRKLNAESWPNP